MRLQPEGVAPKWEDNSAWTQALLIGYEHVRSYEEAEQRASQWLSQAASSV